MKVFKAFCPVDNLLLKSIALLDRFGLGPKDIVKYRHPQEDYFLASRKYPIFAVADGVTLELDKMGRYPDPSGAGEVARIFCEVAVKEAEKVYSRFGKSDLRKVFARANLAVAKYNRSQDRAKAKLNYWDFDLFAATMALAVVKDKLVYWASLCDSFVMCFDKAGRQKFKSPDCWPTLRQNLPQNWLAAPEGKRKKIIRRVYRNGTNKKGELIGYGVVTGEKAAARYLNLGRLAVERGDVVFVLTDGFENHMNLPQFVELFNKWPKDLSKKVKTFIARKSLNDPQAFGKEKTLIAIRF